MRDERLRGLAAAALVIGAVLGPAGSFAPSGELRRLAWGIDGVALHFSGTTFVDAVGTRADAGAFRVQLVDGCVVEIPLTVRPLGATHPHR